ncbi:hypothetical protein BRO06_19195 [Xanthomonas oryzae pv. oryzae]|nr:hypothetical protein BRO06_19195 [Xanthomonas oryzae pv. oryzae]
MWWCGQRHRRGRRCSDGNRESGIGNRESGIGNRESIKSMPRRHLGCGCGASLQTHCNCRDGCGWCARSRAHRWHLQWLAAAAHGCRLCGGVSVA